MAETPLTIDQGKEAWRAYVTERTKAIPKNSLFGTSLENADRHAANTINVSDHESHELTARQHKANQYNHKLPSRLENRSGEMLLQYPR